MDYKNNEQIFLSKTEISTNQEFILKIKAKFNHQDNIFIIWG